MQASDNDRLDQDNPDGRGGDIIDGSLILHWLYDGQIGHLMSDNIMSLRSTCLPNMRASGGCPSEETAMYFWNPILVL